MNRSKICNIIAKQFRFWNADPDPNIIVLTDEFIERYITNDVYPDDPIELRFYIIGPVGTVWEGKQYSGIIRYGLKYPYSPPDIYFTSKLLHPNVYLNTDNSMEPGINGKLCISILHEGHDPYGHEDDASRWTPAHNIGTILRSTYTLFYEPACDSPANIDASNLYIRNRDELRRLIQNS